MTGRHEPDLTWPLRGAARHHGSREAVVDGDTRFTFIELEDRVQRLANGLAGLGVKRGDRVATLLANSFRYLELHFAVPGLGALIVPINSRLALAEMEAIIEDAGVTVLVADEAHAAYADKLEGRVQRVVRIPDAYEALVAESESIPLPGPASPDEPAGLYYTGGTTGLPKGVILSHRALIAESSALALALAFGSDDDQRGLILFPLFHLGAICGIYIAVWQGAAQVFLPVMDPGQILATIERERITSTSGVPILLQAMLAHPALDQTDFSSLKFVAHGAAPIDPTLCRRVAEAFGCEILQSYGMTEMAGGATMLRNEQDLLDDPLIRSAGQAMVGYELDIRRPDGSSCDPGEPGEVVLRGPSMMDGYWNKPEATEAVIRDGWYHSGDVGFRDEAWNVFLVDRAKDMIVSGGENVYSVEVERVLDGHPEVIESAVIGVPDEQWGERVHAVVVAPPETTLTAEAVIAFCRESIAGYKCPKTVDIRVEPLPRSPVGKILKRDLREPFWKDAGRAIG